MTPNITAPKMKKFLRLPCVPTSNRTYASRILKVHDESIMLNISAGMLWRKWPIGRKPSVQLRSNLYHIIVNGHPNLQSTRSKMKGGWNWTISIAWFRTVPTLWTIGYCYSRKRTLSVTCKRISFWRKKFCETIVFQEVTVQSFPWKRFSEINANFSQISFCARKSCWIREKTPGIAWCKGEHQRIKIVFNNRNTLHWWLETGAVVASRQTPTSLHNFFSSEGQVCFL